MGVEIDSGLTDQSLQAIRSVESMSEISRDLLAVTAILLGSGYMDTSDLQEALKYVKEH